VVSRGGDDNYTRHHFWHDPLCFVHFLSNWNLVAKWLRHWTTDPEAPGSQPHYSNRDFFHLGVYSALLKKVSRCILKVLSPEVYTATFRGDVKLSVLGYTYWLV